MKKATILILLICMQSSVFGQIKNLVLEGGGVLGIAYVGALRALEEKNKLSDIENIAGTSVGALTASLMSVGYDSKELGAIMSNLNMKKFNDGRGMFFGGTNRMFKKYGWYRGEKLKSWVNDLLFEKTGKENLTFKELHDLAIKDSRFKNLYVTVTNLSQQNWQTISYLNFPNMRIADAVRMSASIPMYFTAVFMDKEGNVYKKPQKHIATDVMADGGFVSNYPIHIFDSTYALHETLGLQLDRKEQISKGGNELAPYEINNLKDYVMAFYTIVLESMNRTSLEPEDWERTVSISDCEIGPKIKKMPKEDVDKLINAGYEAVNTYFAQ